ncbi:hypothetical protein SUGI_1514490 [Cryptomeria japonica]|nr:hypothetical protein SUGI_1514490 [Cryptomeria japonica]
MRIVSRWSCPAHPCGSFSYYELHPHNLHPPPPGWASYPFSVQSAGPPPFRSVDRGRDVIPLTDGSRRDRHALSSSLAEALEILAGKTLEEILSIMWEREIPDMRREIPDMWKREMEIPDMWEGELPDIMWKEILECGRRRYRTSSCGRGRDGRRYRTSSSRGRKGMQVADRECVVDRLTPGGAPLQLLHDYRPLDSSALYYSGPPPVEGEGEERTLDRGMGEDGESDTKRKAYGPGMGSKGGIV